MHLKSSKIPLIFFQFFKEFELALRVAFSASLSGQPGLVTNQIGALYAFHLFNAKRNFESAFQLFYKLKIDPILVIGLCPDMPRVEEVSKLRYPTSPTVCFYCYFLYWKFSI